MVYCEYPPCLYHAYGNSPFCSEYHREYVKSTDILFVPACVLFSFSQAPSLGVPALVELSEDSEEYLESKLTFFFSQVISNMLTHRRS